MTRVLKCAFWLIAFASPHSAMGDFDVTMWNLNTMVLQQTNEGQLDDSADILTLSNPLIQTAHAQLGQSSNHMQFDYSWLTDEALGTFTTQITHTLRDSDVRVISDGRVFIIADEPLRISLTGSLTYSHTPGDDVGVNFNGRLRNIDTGQNVFLDTNRGGNVYLEPASGTLTMDREAILDPGVTYEFRYVVDTNNSPDLAPTGPVDAFGWVQWQIQPLVPEPTTLALLALFCPALLRKFPRR